MGAATVREFYGALTADRHAVEGILITTSGFTSQAQEFAGRLPIELIGRDQLQRLLEQHGLHTDVTGPLLGSVVGVAPQPKDLVSELLNLAIRMSEQKKNGEAIKLLREATQLRPDDPDLWLRLGICYFRASLYEDSAEACREALPLKPELAAAWKEMGLAYNWLKQFDKAVEAFKDLTRLDPNDAFAWADLGDAYKGKRSRDQALAAYNEAIRLNPQVDSVWIRFGQLHLDSNHYNDAIAAFQKAIRLEPDRASNWYSLGVAYYAQGDLEKRRQVLHRLEELDPQMAREFSRTYTRR